MDIASLLGIIIAMLAVVGGAALEGLSIGALIQPTAAIIVCGGTAGATFVSFPMKALLFAAGSVKRAFFPPVISPEDAIRDILGYAQQARKDGLLSLDKVAKAAKDPFIRKGLFFVVDGVDSEKLREGMELEVEVFEEHTKVAAEVFEAAGGYAPTIGIIGAVLGLIHVMHNLSDPSKLGEGIAVAFVATIYGLLIANVFCLPFATKIKQQVKGEVVYRSMLIEGMVAINKGETSGAIEQKLRAFIPDGHGKGKTEED